MGNHTPPPVSPGDRLGRYRILRFLAEGGMGQVFLAEDENLKRQVAVKVLPPWFADDSLVERFLKEARLCAQISHPNVITIHEVGKERGLNYIVMKYIDGMDLRSVAEQSGGRLPWLAALRIMRPVARGLHAVHEHGRGLIHRDVKPANIMVAHDGQVVLMDFGLARETTQSDLTSAGKALGTPAFMSPEQCRCEVLNRRSDIYSLGASLYSVLTGRKPVTGKNNYELITKIAGGATVRPVHELCPDVPKPVSDLVARAMAFREQDRFPNALAFVQALSALIRDLAPAQEIAGDTEDLVGAPTRRLPEIPLEELVPLESERRRWWRRTAAALIGVLALVGTIAGLVIWSRPTDDAAAALLTDNPANPMTEGMVHIAAGDVHTGSAEEKLRTFWTPFVMNANLLDNLLEINRQEPIGRVPVPAFWIDRYEVTQAQYAEFVRATGHAAPSDWVGGQPPADRVEHPVVNVTYADAEAYATWKGKALPTREQWLRAFRGDKETLFPWGDTYDATRPNVGDNKQFPGTSAVQATPRDVSQQEVYNLSGNASEFIRGTFAHQGQTWHVGKGGEWKFPGFIWAVASMQTLIALDASSDGIGFRCVLEEE